MRSYSAFCVPFLKAIYDTGRVLKNLALGTMHNGHHRKAEFRLDVPLNTENMCASFNRPRWLKYHRVLAEGETSQPKWVYKEGLSCNALSSASQSLSDLESLNKSSSNAGISVDRALRMGCRHLGQFGTQKPENFLERRLPLPSNANWVSVSMFILKTPETASAILTFPIPIHREIQGRVGLYHPVLTEPAIANSPGFLA